MPPLLRSLSMSKRDLACPVCDGDGSEFDRRQFIRVAGAAAAVAAMPAAFRGAESASSTPETLVKKLYDSLSESQKKDGGVRLGPSGSETRPACGRTCPTTGTSPSRKFAATFTPRTSRTSAGRSMKGCSSPIGSSRSTSNCKTTRTARLGHSAKHRACSASRARSSRWS